MRKLASVQRVADITPIDGADAIELAHIQGWQCVVKKGEFQPGDLGVFFEIDSIPPDDERFRFLWATKDNLMPGPGERPAKYRLRTMRLRGALSQGLLLPLEQFYRDILDWEPGVPATATLWEGADVTDLIGVEKWEPPLPMGGDQRAAFPTHLAYKTDEPRIQSNPEFLERMQGEPFVATEKLDGTSATFLWVDDEFHVCGRNWSVTEGENVYWAVARKYDLANKLRGSGLVIQGEIVGPGVQGNPLGLKQVELRVFDVTGDAKTRLGHLQAEAVAAELDLPFATTVMAGRFDWTDIDDLLALADGCYHGTDRRREGLVFRHPDNLMVGGERLSFKVISNAYLLKQKD